MLEVSGVSGVMWTTPRLRWNDGSHGWRGRDRARAAADSFSCWAVQAVVGVASGQPVRSWGDQGGRLISCASGGCRSRGREWLPGEGAGSANGQFGKTKRNGSGTGDPGNGERIPALWGRHPVSREQRRQLTDLTNADAAAVGLSVFLKLHNRLPYAVTSVPYGTCNFQPGKHTPQR